MLRRRTGELVHNTSETHLHPTGQRFDTRPAGLVVDSRQCLLEASVVRCCFQRGGCSQTPSGRAGLRRTEGLQQTAVAGSICEGGGEGAPIGRSRHGLASNAQVGKTIRVGTHTNADWH